MSDEKKAGYLFQLTQQVGQDKSVSISGNLPIGASTEDMVSEMDKILDAFEIQNTKRMKLPVLMGELRDQKDALEKSKAELKLLTEGTKPLNSAQKQTAEQLKARIRTLRDEAIPKGEEIVAVMLKKAGINNLST